MDGFLFVSRAAAQPWLEQQIIRAENLVYTMPDNSPAERAGAGKKIVQIYEEILQNTPIDYCILQYEDNAYADARSYPSNANGG